MRNTVPCSPEPEPEPEGRFDKPFLNGPLGGMSADDLAEKVTDSLDGRVLKKLL